MKSPHRGHLARSSSRLAAALVAASLLAVAGCSSSGDAASGDGTAGAFRDYATAVTDGMVVLDAVHQIQAEQATDLAVRWNCKAGKCGSCSAEVNGRPRLMCMTRLNQLDLSEPVTVEPMRALISIIQSIVLWEEMLAVATSSATQPGLPPGTEEIMGGFVIGAAVLGQAIMVLWVAAKMAVYAYGRRVLASEATQDWLISKA